MTSNLPVDFLGVLGIFRTDKLSTLKPRKSMLRSTGLDRVRAASQDPLQLRPALSTRLRNSKKGNGVMLTWYNWVLPKDTDRHNT